MKLDFGSGRSPRAGSAALALEQTSHTAEKNRAGSAVISAGTSARAVEQSHPESLRMRTAELSFSSAARRERIFTPRPNKDEVAASPATGVLGGVDVTPQTASRVAPEVGSEKEHNSKLMGAVPASQSNSEFVTGPFSPLESVLRLFSKHKAPNVNPS